MESLAPDALEAVLRLLEVEDVCHVAKCSQYLAGVCCSDDLWRQLYLARWPRDAALMPLAPPCLGADVSAPMLLFSVLYLFRWARGATFMEQDAASEGSAAAGDGRWRERVRGRHAAAVARGREIQALVEGSLSYHEAASFEVFEYHKCLGALEGSGLCFGDVARLLLGSHHSVLLNLLGLHYCIQHLDVPASTIARSLAAQGVSDRAVCVRWWTMGSWAPLGYRLRDQMRMSRVTLGQLASPAVVHQLRARYSQAHRAREGGQGLVAPPGLGPGAQSLAGAGVPGTHSGAGAGVPGAHSLAGAGVLGAHSGGAALVGVPGAHPGAGEQSGAMGVVPLVSSLGEAEQEALRVGRRLVEGAVHEVMRVQIAADFQQSAWVGRDMAAISHVQLGSHSRSYPAAVQ